MRRKAAIRRRWTLWYQDERMVSWRFKPTDDDVERVIRVHTADFQNLGRYQLCYDGRVRASWTASVERC